jgi:hypothetical protein
MRHTESFGDGLSAAFQQARPGCALTDDAIWRCPASLEVTNHPSNVLILFHGLALDLIPQDLFSTLVLARRNHVGNIGILDLTSFERGLDFGPDVLSDVGVFVN